MFHLGCPLSCFCLGPYHFSPLLYSWALEVAPGSEVPRECSEVPGARAEQVDFYCPRGLHCEGSTDRETDGMAAPIDTPQGALNSEGWQGDSRRVESDGGALYLQSWNIIHRRRECLQRDSQAVMCPYLGRRGRYAATSRYSVNQQQWQRRPRKPSTILKLENSGKPLHSIEIKTYLRYRPECFILERSRFMSAYTTNWTR